METNSGDGPPLQDEDLQAAESASEADLRRNEELVRWIEEFIQSDEFHSRSLDHDNLEEKGRHEAETIQETPPDLLLIEVQRRFRRETARFEEEVRRGQVKKVIEGQDEAIEQIRAKISEVKRRNVCHKDEREARTQKQKKRIFESLKKRYDLSIPLPPKVASILINKVTTYNKIRHVRLKNKRSRYVAIVKKLLKELQGRQKPHKPIEMKIIKGMVVIGKAAILHHAEDVKMTIDVDEKQEEVGEEKLPTPPKVIVEKKTKAKKKSKKTKSSTSKSSKKKKSSKSSKAKRKKGRKVLETNELILPQAPLTNKRDKIKPELLDILPDLVHDELLKKSENYVRSFTYPIDSDFDWNPKVLEFDGFKNGESYQRKLTVTNVNVRNKLRSFRFLKICLDDMDSTMIQVEPLGVCRIPSGLSCKTCITFLPTKCAEDITGSLIFLTTDPDNSETKQFQVPLYCRFKKTCDIKLTSSRVDFKTIPVWKIKNTTKSFKVCNIGDIPTKVLITKVRTAFSFCEGENEDSIGLFRFSESSFDLNPKQEVKVGVGLQNIDCVGSYVEKYLISSCSSTNGVELSVSAEVSGKFITVEPTALDFEVCVFDSLYQLIAEVRNSSRVVQNLRIKFPRDLQNCLSCNFYDFFLQPDETQNIVIRFIPRIREILDFKTGLYDSETKILEFDVKVCVVCKNYADTPPTELHVYAILTDSNGMSIEPGHLDMSECGTHEAVATQVVVRNDSLVRQEYGFLDLPPYILLSPNYGFGQLLPGESQNLTLYFLPVTSEHARLNFSISLSTLKQIGGLKNGQYNNKKISLKKLRKASLLVQNELQGSVQEDRLESCMKSCLEQLRSFSSSSVDDESEKPKEVEAVFSNQLRVDATIVKPFCEFSYSYVEFPDTPCGSYSMVHVDLNVVDNIGNCICGYAYDQTNINADYQVHLKLSSDCDQIQIEPTCGTIQNRQKLKLTLVAKPQLSDDLIQTRAKAMKRLETREVEPKGVKRKETTRKQENEVVISGGDLYPAEMSLFETLETYVIRAKITCVATFDGSQNNRKPEMLYLRAICRVVRPDFVHNMNYQRIDFGSVPLGVSERKVLALRNISEITIRPTVSLLNPIASFVCPKPDGRNGVDPQHVLLVPITFRPTEEREEIEYLEIRANRTVYSLVLTGQGVCPVFKITPDFVVCRLEAKTGGFADCSLEFKNESKVKLKIGLTKLYEVEGEIKAVVKKDVVTKRKLNKKSKQGKSDKSSRSSKKAKPKKFSQELTEEELSSIENDFCPRISEPYFEVLGEPIEVPEVAKKVVKIRFGRRLSPPSPKPKASKKKKGARSTRSKSSTSSGRKEKSARSTRSKSSTREKGAKSKKKVDLKKYVAKYNVVLGTYTVVKEIIIIGSFK